MPIVVITCRCGSTESVARNFLRSVDYADWMNIPIHQGKENSLAVLNQLPPSSDKEMLQSLLKNASKWIVIIGYNQDNMKWSDISHNGPKSRIEAEFVVRNFEFD